MPAGSFHPGLCTNTTPARAAHGFLGGTCVCSPGKEKNSKKHGNMQNFAWATLGRRLGPEQSLGARQDEHGAASCGKANGRFFSVCFPRGGKREKMTGRQWEICVSLEIIGRKTEVKEQDAFESWNDACWLVYCVWFWKTFAYAFKRSEMAVLDSDPYLGWLLIQLGIYWKRGSEEGRGMQVCLQRLLTMPMLYVLPYDVGKRPDQFCLSCWIFF